MAAWQASFHVIVPGALPAGYRERLSSFLPRGRHWHREYEMWGVEDGDMVDLCPSDDPPEVLARFDLRSWRPDLYEQFITFVRDIGGTLRDAEDDSDISLRLEAFLGALRSSRAARFVRDPEAYFEELRRNPIAPEEP